MRDDQDAGRWDDPLDDDWDGDDEDDEQAEYEEFLHREFGIGQDPARPGLLHRITVCLLLLAFALPALVYFFSWLLQ